MSDTEDQDTLNSYINSKISYLHRQLNAGSSAANAQLARLRRGAGSPPENHPELLWYVLKEDVESGAGEFPKQYRGKGEKLTPGEQAAYNALTLFALHQQSQLKSMHNPNITFATAVGQLVAATTPSMKVRFDALLKARTEKARLRYLRSLIALLRAHEIAFNYGRFAKDYMKLLNSQKHDSVILWWGREFVYGYTRRKKKEESENSGSESTQN